MSLKAQFVLLSVCSILSFVSGCDSGGNDGAAVKTDLGAVGNALVARDFHAYQAKPTEQHCHAQGDGKHVIVTGFGLFSGASYNISGVVVESMSDPRIWSGRVVNNVSLPVEGEPTVTPADGVLERGQYGGRVVNREISVDGRAFQVCFIHVDVRWDIAGAIIAHEMNVFKPEMVIMSGRGGKSRGLFLEGGAINNALLGSGYAGDGRELGEANIPVNATPYLDAPILADKPSGDATTADKVRMTWDNRMLGNLMADIVQPLDWLVTSVPDARADNDYICNNVSYIALNAAKGEQLKLGGEEIQVKLDVPLLNAKIGFLHYPSDARRDARTVQVMAAGIAAMINAQLH